MITVIEHEVSDKLANEIREIARSIVETEEAAGPHSAAEYYADFASSVRGLELLERVGPSAQPLSVLDIGVGRGESTFLLSSRGHRVSCIEPSPDLCSLIDRMSTRFGLDVGIYQCTAEQAHLLPETDFDVCIFNSSLHHCDDPVGALANCYRLLRRGGRVVVVNEPLLRFYRSHAWFYRRLATHPVQMGHYGGNEHIYRHAEYLNLLQRAGFNEVRAFLNVRNTEPRLALKDLLWREIDDRPVYGEGALLVRFLWLLALKKALRAGAVGQSLGRVAMRLSLVYTSYVGVK